MEHSVDEQNFVVVVGRTFDITASGGRSKEKFRLGNTIACRQ
jgi:uncharacterized protein Veg